MRQKKIKDNVKETINNRKFGGKLPNSWLTNPLPGELIDDCLLPIKCPLHDNFDQIVLDSGGQLFKVLFRRFVEIILMEHIQWICSLESQLFFISICSIRTRSRNRVIFEIN